MNEYEFYLKFKMGSDQGDPTEIMNSLAEADCTDATVQFGLPGYVRLDFIRESRSAEEAIISAAKSSRSALQGAELVEAGPDFVGLTDVADLLEMSRQNMRYVFLSNALSFPAPVHEGTASVWHLSMILDFLKNIDRYEINPCVQDVALWTMQLNRAREFSLYKREIGREKLQSLFDRH